MIFFYMLLTGATAALQAEFQRRGVPDTFLRMQGINEHSIIKPVIINNTESA